MVGGSGSRTTGRVEPRMGGVSRERPVKWEGRSPGPPADYGGGPTEGAPSTRSMIRIIDPGSKILRETRVLLLRHAETAAPDRFHGAESDIGLGERGREQAEEVARTLAGLRPDALYCSAMRRAVETAGRIGRACGLVPQRIASLHERRMGPLSGRSKQDGTADYDQAKA